MTTMFLQGHLFNLQNLAYIRPYEESELAHIYDNFNTDNSELAKQLTNFIAVLNVKHLLITMNLNTNTNWVNFKLPNTIKSIEIHFKGEVGNQASIVEKVA